ncbi:MAG TPA: FAD-binding oxidoreductase [Pseudolysinimonas sp.]|jgi:FAD/FMN-containing dehydrogenase|nr:FAD-binding oxidoreductase [Pseudolysinimonas sp.]
MLSDLRDGRAGTALLPDDPGWGENPPIYPPAGTATAVVRPETAQQVAEALSFAAAEGMPVAVRSGGHGSGRFSVEGALVIELSHLAGVEVGGTTVRIGAGAVWGDVAAALGAHGLALSSGDTKSVGVGGLTLGGGVGWFVRQYGLAFDSLIAAEVALPSGEVVTASATEHPDLFWALRGGGGNFGVVTTFVFEGHPLDGVVFGTLDFDPANLREMLAGWRDVMREAPEPFNSTALAMPAMGPGAEPATQLIVIHPGRDVAVIEPLLERLRAVPGYRGEDIAPRDYADTLDEAHPFPGEPPTITGDNGFIDDFGDDAIEALAGVHAAIGGVLMLRYLRGAFSRVPADATAWAHRGAEVMAMVAAFLPPAAEREAVDAVHAKWAPAGPYATGTYGNFSQEAGQAVTELMYPPATLERLREVKRRYDPQNLLRANHNIVP